MRARTGGGASGLRGVCRAVLATASVLALFAVVGAGWLVWAVKGSLPQLEGEAIVAGLSAPVMIARDALGIPTIRGADRLDIARATGFLHAQERYFQMDLLRRAAAGELAALFGDAALAPDRAVRIHRFRMRARAAVASLVPEERALVEAYAAGANAGLAALRAPPFEYLVLRDAPAEWLPEDTLLVVYSMYLDLQGLQWRRESVRGVLHDVLPELLFEFLSPPGTEWDTPVQGLPWAAPAVPGPQVVDLRTQLPAAARPQAEVAAIPNDTAPGGGSNNWALAGRYTVHGGAVLANDMHLRIGVPNTWYRASWVYPHAGPGTRRVTGITLPGTPALVVGSNGKVAWGFTNSEGDWSDLVILEPGPDAADTYLTPHGPRRFEHHRETLRVKNGRNRELDVVETIWGPVIDTDHRGRRRALRWVAHERAAVDLALLGLESVGTVGEAMEVANRAGAPAQNFVVADADGHIGWTILGPVPRRFGHDGRVPRSWAKGDLGWDGWLTPAEYPRIVDPPAGRLWTANARVIGGDMLARLGDGGYALGARARQIRDALLAMNRVGEADLLALQLDDRALFLERWRALLLEVLSPQALAADPRRRELRRYVKDWGGRADVDSVGYRMVRAFRALLGARVFAPLTASARRADERFDYTLIRTREGPLWRLVSEQPPHLLDPRYETWQEQFLAVVDALLDRFLSDGTRLGEHTWGERNTSEFRHPLSRFMPAAGRWLDLPRLPLPGDLYMPRVQTPTTGASERMVVSPGFESEGILHMPGGQSAHPFSPHFRDGHRAWARGEHTPFLPGPAEHILTLVP